jgi:hypothetical protein
MKAFTTLFCMGSHWIMNDSMDYEWQPTSESTMESSIGCIRCDCTSMCVCVWLGNEKELQPHNRRKEM